MRRLALLLLLLATPATGETLIQRNPGGQPTFDRPTGAWTTNDLVCVTGPNEISTGGTCNALGGGGSGSLESSGATSTRAVCLDEELAVTSGQSTATTTDTITAGSIVVKCVSRTNVAVSGGYFVGVANVPDAWGAAAGSLGDTNNLDVTMPGPTAVSTATAVVATSTHSSGQFQSSTGRIRVVCFCDEIGAPTE